MKSEKLLSGLALHITARSQGTRNQKPPLADEYLQATSHKALVPMRAPDRTSLLKCPQVVGSGFEPRLSDRELDPQT